MLEERLDRDLKTALLNGDSVAVSTLRSLKSAILYAKVAGGNRSDTLPEEALLAVLQKEAKKRQESVEAYQRAGNEQRAHTEAREKEIIEQYLPAKLSEAEVVRLIDATISELGDAGNLSMGVVISTVRQKAAGAADGALIARLTKERLGL